MVYVHVYDSMPPMVIGWVTSSQVMRRHLDDVALEIPCYALWFSSVCRENE